jgi:hypothetical protein
MNGKIRILSFFLLASLLVFSCHKEKTGKIVIHFTASVDDKPLAFNKMTYQNASGNKYSIEEVKYFISDLILTDKKGKRFQITGDNSIHYVDHAISSTETWEIKDLFPVGEYRSLSFTFGLSQEKNISNFFVNPPECNMSWPSTLGGGYHYMQINGKWLHDEVETPFNIHTGISRLVSPDSLISYTHHFFTVSLADIKFEIQKDKPTEIILNMNINEWFTNPENYDFNDYGTGIMENYKAQEILKKNGWNVFGFSLHKMPPD